VNLNTLGTRSLVSGLNPPDEGFFVVGIGHLVRCIS
jgi:hypothetical protein